MTEGTAGRPIGTSLGPLGRRLLLAFVSVAGIAVVLVVAAAMVGTSQGISTTQQTQRDEITAGIVRAAAESYQRASGWSETELGAVFSQAETAGAHVIIRDVDGAVVAANVTTPGNNGTGMGNGGNTNGRSGRRSATATDGGMISDGAANLGYGMVTAPVQVGAAQVGTVTIGFGRPVSTSGRTIAWTWIAAAAVGAGALAVLLGYAMSRLLTRPVVALTEAARAFGAGDRSARPSVRGHGELAELAVAFDEAAETVDRSERIRRQMAADVAHELRTPLAALQAELEELRDGLVPADPGTLARLHDQSLRLARVVDDLAELSAAEASVAQIDARPVPVLPLVRDEVSARQAQLRAAGLSVTVHSSVPDRATVLGDPFRLHQVIGNVLQNCARHCRAGDEVTVTVDGPRTADQIGGSGKSLPGSSPGPGQFWQIVVRDTGPGIPVDELPEVFTRFWRSSRTGESPGSGLGLAVVQTLVQAHHGTVRVDSDGATGTTVTIALPASTPEPGDAEG